MSQVDSGLRVFDVRRIWPEWDKSRFSFVSSTGLVWVSECILFVKIPRRRRAHARKFRDCVEIGWASLSHSSPSQIKCINCARSDISSDILTTRGWVGKRKFC